jgi:metal-sulfur cluster biosynthetic enzyme
MIADGPRVPQPLTTERVTQALRTVLDPELGMSIVDLGLVYGIDVDGDAVTVLMTLTAPGCPIHDVMAAWVRAAIMGIPGVERVEVTLTFDPPWTPARVTTPSVGEAREPRDHHERRQHQTDERPAESAVAPGLVDADGARGCGVGKEDERQGEEPAHPQSRYTER